MSGVNGGETDKTREQIEEQLYAPAFSGLSEREKVLIMIAIMASMLFASLNQTVVGTAMPRIIAVLGGVDYYSWVFTIFMLTSSITTILVGRLSDIYGRKPFILLGLCLFSLGAFLSGTSQNIFQLIVYRGLQGIGGGMIMSTSMTAVGDIFTPRERGRWQGYMSMVWGTSSIIGPAVGGYIVDFLDWRWVFWVNLPVGIVAFTLIARLFPAKKRDGEKEPIDYWGSLLIVVALLPLLLGFSWAGTVYDWGSPVILSLLCTAVFGLVLFVFNERRAAKPVMPMEFFKNSIFSLSNVVNFTVGIGMFGTIMYMPLFLQGVLGKSATESGMTMVPMTLAMMTASNLSGQLTTRTGKYKLLALSGLLIMALGMFLLTTMDTQTKTWQVILNVIFVGFGMGITMPIFVLIVQNAFPQQVLGVVTSSVQLFRQMGGTIGVAVMGTIMSRAMSAELHRTLPEEAREALGDEHFESLSNPQALLDPQMMSTIRDQTPPEMQGVLEELMELLRLALDHALNWVFWFGVLVVGTAFALSFFIKEIPLRGPIRSGKRK